MPWSESPAKTGWLQALWPDPAVRSAHQHRCALALGAGLSPCDTRTRCKACKQASRTRVRGWPLAERRRRSPYTLAVERAPLQADKPDRHPLVGDVFEAGIRTQTCEWTCRKLNKQ